MQCEQKDNKRKAAEHDQGVEEENGPPDEDIKVVDVFKDFQTSTKNSLSDATRAAVVSTFFFFP